MAHYDLTVTVRDGGHADWQCHSAIQIEITDINDNPPKFSEESYSVNVPENSPQNILMMKIHATDPDLGENGVFYYTLNTIE